MLASTVKFSRCGRQAGRRFLAPVSDSARRSVAYATEPSGPNSVLGLSQPTRRGSTPDKTGSTDDKIGQKGLLVNVPHSGAYSIPIECWKSSAGQICDL